MKYKLQSDKKLPLIGQDLLVMVLVIAFDLVLLFMVIPNVRVGYNNSIITVGFLLFCLVLLVSFPLLLYWGVSLWQALGLSSKIILTLESDIVTLRGQPVKKVEIWERTTHYLRGAREDFFEAKFFTGNNTSPHRIALSTKQAFKLKDKLADYPKVKGKVITSN